MPRAIILVLDSLGIGASDDARDFGDTGADTLGHIAEAVPLSLPNLSRLGRFVGQAVSNMATGVLLAITEER